MNDLDSDNFPIPKNSNRIAVPWIGTGRPYLFVFSSLWPLKLAITNGDICNIFLCPLWF
jgi:hypothetical protein